MRRPWLIPPLVLIMQLFYCTVGRAGLEGDPSAFQAGDIHAGAALAHHFVLVNRGPETVEIVEVRPSCGCVTATPDRRRFGAGESGSLLLEVNTLTQPDGPTSWRVTLRCRAGDRIEDTMLTLTARIQADLSLEPSALAIETETAVDRTITLTDRRAASMTLKVEATCQQMRAWVEAPAHSADGAWTYTIKLHSPADLPEGRHDEVLHIYTSDPEYPDLKLPFTIVKRTRQRVSATPAAVELTVESPSRLVLLRGSNGEEVEVEGADAEVGEVHCEWAAEARPTGAVRIRVDAAKLPPDGLMTTVHIRLARPAGQTLDVPVTCAPP